MSLIIRRLLRMFVSLRFIKKVHPVTYTGKDIPSSNDIYQSRHWGYRLKLEMDFTKKFRTIFDNDKNTPRAKQFGVVLFYNNMMDVDNLSFIAKVAVDAYRQEIKTVKVKAKDPKTKKMVVVQQHKELVYEGFVQNDDQRFYRFLCLFPDKNLPKNTVELNFCIL